MPAGVAEPVAGHAEKKTKSGRHKGQPGGFGVENLLEEGSRIAHAGQQQQAMPGQGHRPQATEAEGMRQRQRHDLAVFGRRAHEGVDVQRGLGDVLVRQQHAFAPARRAGGIEQVARIVQCGPGRPERLALVRAGDCGEVFDGDGASSCSTARAPMRSVGRRKVARFPAKAGTTQRLPR